MAAQLFFGAGHSVGFGTSGSTNTNIASCSKASLSNMQVGDMLIAWIHNQSSTSGTITAPSGWTRYGAAIGVPDMSSSRLSGFYCYPLTDQAAIDALPETITWTFSQSARIACVVARATGIDLVSPLDAASTGFTSSSGASFNIAAITTTTTDTLLIGGLYHQNAANTAAPSTTAFMTEFQEYHTDPTGAVLATSGNTGGALGYRVLTAAGSTGATAATYDAATTVTAGEVMALKIAAPSITRPAIVGTATTYVSSAAVTSFMISKPTDYQDGDVLIMALSAQTPTATGDFACSGWSRIGRSFLASSAGYRVIGFYALPVPTAADLTALDFTFTSTDSASGGRICAEMFIVRGAELSNLVAATSLYGGSDVQTVTVGPEAPQVNNNLLLIAYGAQFVSGIDYSIATGPTGMTQYSFQVSSTGAVSKTTLAVYQQDIESGSPGTKSLTWAGTQSQTSGVAVAIRAIGEVDANPGVAVKHTSSVDTLSTAHLFYTSATDTRATPVEVRPFPTGYMSVSAMLATSPFYVAHRGGSFSWPEMSLHAYTQAGFWGVGALELSLARTSDGVWFGLHDTSLDRTSLGTGGSTLIPSSMTWAQVQAYEILGSAATQDPSQPNRPYMRWEEIIDAYYSTHVIFVDPKVAGSYTSELLDMMDALPGTPTDHFVAKYYGVSGNVANTTGWAYEAGNRGYTTWGYFYQADAANFAAYQGRWDILGMDYNADQATWNSILSYGKPVIGHIMPSSVAISTALSRGATGLMVSGVASSIPRSP